MLALEILNSDATVNTFFDIGSFKLIGGETAKLVMRIKDPAKNLRYIPLAGATFSMEFLTSDSNITITKTPVYSFDPDDRSVLKVEFTDAETLQLISQNLKLTITEGASITIARLQSGLTKLSAGGC